jgi:hypothetical protein
MLRIYKHPTDETKIIAKYYFEDVAGTMVTDEFLISELPVDKLQARAHIINQLVLAAPPDLTILEVDNRDEMNDDLQPFIDQINSELSWLDSFITDFGTLTNAQKLEAIERLARENRAVLKALRYLAARL